MKRIIIWIVALVAAAFMLPILCNLIFGYFVARGLQQALPLGWWHVIHRNFAEMSLNWNLIGMAVLCSVLMVVIGHFLFKSLFTFVQQAPVPSQLPRHWRWQWTLGLYLGLWILFAIACSAAGLRDQISWLAKDNKPWLEERLNARYALKELEIHIRMLLSDADDDLYATHKAYMAEPEQGRSGQLLSDTANVIFYGAENGKVAAYLVIPRQPQLAKKGLFAVGMADPPEFTVKKEAELAAVLSALDSKYPHKR